MMRRFRRNDEAVTEVIGYVLSFALSAIFLLIALNVFTAARANTDHVVTGVELRTIADRIAGRIVEMGLVSVEFENVTMDVSLIIPQSLNGRLYTITASTDYSEITAATNDGALNASATTYNTEALPYIEVLGSVDSSNEIVRLHYELVPSTPNNIRRITLLGE